MCDSINTHTHTHTHKNTHTHILGNRNEAERKAQSAQCLRKDYRESVRISQGSENKKLNVSTQIPSEGFQMLSDFLYTQA